MLGSCRPSPLCCCLPRRRRFSRDLDEHPMVDARMDWPGRLHRAMELLDKAHQDIAHEEDNQFAQGLQQRAFEHIDKAKHEVGEAIRIVAARY